MKSLFIKEIVLIILCLLSSWKVYPQSQTKSDGWKTVERATGEEKPIELKELKGQKAFFLKNGTELISQAKQYRNFVVELDFLGEGMPGVGFRNSDDANYELVYMRMAGSGQKWALVYLPVYNGTYNWQLYTYPNHEFVAEYKNDDWNHMKMVVFEDQMQVFINNSATPQINTRLLHDQVSRGGLILNSSFADAHFANIKIKEINKNPFSEVIPVKNCESCIKEWEISEQFKFDYSNLGDLTTNYKKYRDADNLKAIKADARGIVNLCKYSSYPENTVMAKTILKAEKAVNKTLYFDYTMSLTIFLNDQVVFSGFELDSENMGQVIDGEEKVELKLKEGINTLIFVINGSKQIEEQLYQNKPYRGKYRHANWGFITRLSDLQGIAKK